MVTVGQLVLGATQAIWASWPMSQGSPAPMHQGLMPEHPLMYLCLRMLAMQLCMLQPMYLQQ